MTILCHHNNKVKLHWDNAKQIYGDATVTDKSYVRVCHQGYISLFPLLLGIGVSVRLAAFSESTATRFPPAESPGRWAAI